MLYDRITVRRASAGDADALGMLAVLDAAEPLGGDVLVAEVDGTLWVALSLETGAVVADPFRPTLELRSLLALRAAHIRAAGARPRRPRLRAIRDLLALPGAR
jgi:hypothetical protein